MHHHHAEPVYQKSTAKTVHDRVLALEHNSRAWVVALAHEYNPRKYRNGLDLFFVYDDGSCVILREDDRVIFTKIDEAALVKMSQTKQFFGSP